ncbi:hypothetical protein KY341_05965, partial [Candidatus Woesearchaeota archaeon]|nr:hypothetical protein [Candidatus Woesearchaeota archaeon]
KIYYPLKPTSVYGDTVVPAVIYVMGYVQPELYKEIKADSEITFFSESTHKAPKDLKDFYSGYSLPAISSRESNYYISNLEYTKVKISAPSNALIQDLWFKNEVPNKVVVYESLINRIIWWGLIIFIFISCLSSLLAGIIVFRNDNPHLFKFALFGLFNFLTLVGVWIAAYIKGVDHAFTERKQAVYQRIKLEGRQKTAIAIPLSIIIVITLLIPVSILLQLQDIIFPLLFSLFVGFIFFPFIIFVPLILWGYYKHKKVLVFNLVFSGMFLVLLILSRIILAIFI